MNLKKLTLLFVFIAVTYSGYSQFSNQLGIMAGPVAFQSDYGETKNFDNIKGNVGYNVGIIHYMNFAFDASCNCFNRYSWFNDHFMLRNELSYTNVKLDHFGQWVAPDRTSYTAEQLRSMHGNVKNINLGTQLEFHPISLREFISGSYLFVPYGALGLQVNFASPENISDLGDITDPNVLPDKFFGTTTNDAQTVFSFTANIGLRLKINRRSDVIIDARYQYYFSDVVEGMEPDPEVYTENKYNDTAVYLSLGYIMYL
ncbi:hypothetical protein SAMN05216480_101331 [Pustulibacterium marinum]|uniref:Outer membrane protein beta-barrel domain-containing protein n=1 Tax=Pustulibacterium marinum TaxID=1224947 RepID=A0A1I7EWA4_9FLAO|nr:glutamate dehydrogenase [Pustulibacterium marinum]SFU28169.1 hypothetical protein SAMN05216480_101331 [Pustulibacterium marinum]